MLSLLTLCLVSSSYVAAEPVAYWKTREDRYYDGQIVAIKGPNLMVSGFPKSESVGGETGLRLSSEADAMVYPWDSRREWREMPKRAFTVSVWFSGTELKGNQGVAACIFQPKEGLTGWRLVLRDGKPEFTMANHGSEGKPVEQTVRSSQTLSPAKLHRLDATYDGSTIRLSVDGSEGVKANASFGDIVYNGRAGICLGDWWEGPRSFHFSGFYSRVAVFDQALEPSQVDASLAQVREQPMPAEETANNRIVIQPYFQYPTTNSATVMWKTSAGSSSVVKLGESIRQTRRIEGKPGRVHEGEIAGLKASTTYFVQVESERNGKTVQSDWASFRTAAEPGTPVKFAVVGDTQDHPETNKIVGAAMFAERPDFAMIVGDLVGMGWMMQQWENDFFASLRPLLSHVPLLPVLGNHERNARIYYDLMSAPQPEYYYTYVTGDVQIWVIDTEHHIHPGSEQYRWLERTMAASTAKWKITAHHFPPYSSDFDDYGESLEGPIAGGDVQVRQLSALYDKYHVDLCFSGHIHSYERSYPLVNGKVTLDRPATTYVVVGGGGGDLEQFAATRQTFSHTVRTGHHFGTVSADPRKLEFRAYDLNSRLFDTFTLTK